MSAREGAAPFVEVASSDPGPGGFNPYPNSARVLIALGILCWIMAVATC